MHGKGRNASAYRAVISPVASKFVWLSGRHQGEGLGHSMASFLTLVRIAREHQLTLNANFTTSGRSDYQSSNVEGFLGFSSFFSEPCRVPPANAIVRQFKNVAEFELQVDQYIRDVVERDHHASGHVLKILDQAPPQDMRDLPFLRALFLAMNGRRRLVSSLAGLPVHPAKINIVVHIRRGDIDSNPRWLTRFVPTEVYRRVVDSILPEIRLQFASSEFLIEIFVLCEGAEKGIAENGNFLTVRAISARCQEDARCAVSIFDENSLISLSLMCQADILITSRSGFSHLASSLCARGITVALPFWHSYQTSQNVVVADVPYPDFGIEVLLKISTGAVDAAALGRLLKCLKRRKME